MLPVLAARENILIPLGIGECFQIFGLNPIPMAIEGMEIGTTRLEAGSWHEYKKPLRYLFVGGVYYGIFASILGCVSGYLCTIFVEAVV